ncbi:unnamed protein product [Calypogeia fissa]
MGKDPALKGGGRKQRRGGNKNLRLTRRSGGIASTFLKAIGKSEERRRESANTEDADEIEGDVYEYEEGVPEEERGKNKRFDDIDRLEYELPSDFEDEEIDEDAAFGGDEDDAVIKKVAKKKAKEIDLNSDEDSGDEDEDDEDEDEDLEEDDNAAEDDEEQAEAKSSDRSDEEEEEEEGDEDGDEDDNEDDDEGRHSRMIEAVTGKAVAGRPDREGRRGKERVFSEAYPESEFNLNPSSGNKNGKSGITIEDLMTPLQDTAGFGNIRKRMEQLQKRGAPLDAPLPKVIQDRVNRKAGYEKTSEDIIKWQSTVKMNREAPTLVFNKREHGPSLSTASLAASFQPTTDLEKEVHSLFCESKLAEVQDVEAAEALELNKLTVEEVRERQERLAKMRNLLFRHELKAKRMKKIKSKTFHRLLQKDQKSKADVDAAIAGADPEASKAAAIKREFNRAQERMTLKHKNSSRWAKRILKRGLNASENDGTRDAIAEQLRTHAALTRKIQSANLSDSDEASSDSEEEAEDAVSGLVLEGNGKSKVLAKAKVATLKALEEGDEGDLPTSGLFSLPFMARAIEKKKKAAQNEAMAILEQLEQAEQDGTVLRLDDDYSRSQNGHLKEATTSGRISFGEAKQANARLGRRQTPGDIDHVSDEDSGEESEQELTDNSTIARVTSDKLSAPGMMNSSRTDSLVANDDELEARHETENQNRGEISQNGRISYSGVVTVLAKKMKVSIAGSQRKLAGNGVSVERPSQTKEPHTAPDRVSTHEAVTQSTFSDDDSDDEKQEVGLLDASGSQQDLIRQAFAGDDVEAEFEKVKSQVLDEEVPLGDRPVSLPGWGQWTHVQKIRGQPAWLLKEQELVKTKRENALSKRKDAQMKHVIISEKLDKKAAKYTAPSVPFPFSSREVFERSIRQPIGRDFNTDKAFRDMTRPAVIKSAGVIIDPITLDKDKMSVKRKEPPVTASATKKKKHR